VLLLHALFIGAILLLHPTLHSQIREGNWYDHHSSVSP
jgi:hypothetical protein